MLNTTVKRQASRSSRTLAGSSTTAQTALPYTTAEMAHSKVLRQEQPTFMEVKPNRRELEG